MKKQTEVIRGFTGAALLFVLLLVPLLALAETDRITVEDPSTGVIKYKVTSDGNVTATSYTGDGAALTNVAHWKGSWSNVTAYAKDDCVYYGGGSYIALAASTNAVPSSTPASWAVMAAQGPVGAAGAAGSTGPQGLTGATGAQGPAGSPDTQAQILTKLATRTDGAIFALQQGLTEPSTVNKLSIRDYLGNDRFFITANGFLNLNGTTAEIHNRVNYDTPAVRPVFVAERSRGTQSVPTVVQLNDKLGSFAFSGYDGSGYQTGGLFEAFVDGTVTSGSVPTRFSIVTGTGSSNRFERLVVKNTGEIGIGTNAPTQLLDVNSNGIRIRTSMTPASSTAACNQGDMAWDASYVYVCVATNSWKRSGLAAW